MIQPEIKVVPDRDAMAAEAADRFAHAAAEAIEKHGIFSVALSGGQTPRALFEVLAREPYRALIDWTKVEIFFGDERCVPPDSSESNYGMAYDTLLSHVPIPGDNIYRMHGEIDPQAAAIEYGQMLKEKFGDGGLDLILLGMGPDGHTASLFPQTEGLNETKHRAVANFVPKLNTWRITMTVPFINRARQVMFLVGGADKAERVAEILEGPRDLQRLPAQLIEPIQGTVVWILDVQAAGMAE
jgi:6-phosphogluconolactonase